MLVPGGGDFGFALGGPIQFDNGVSSPCCVANPGPQWGAPNHPAPDDVSPDDAGFAPVATAMGKYVVPGLCGVNL